MKYVLLFLFFCIHIFSQKKIDDRIILIPDTKILVFTKCNDIKKIEFSGRNNSDKEIEISDFSYTVLKENQMVREESMGFITTKKKDSENEKIIISAKTTIRGIFRISIPWKLLKGKLYFYDLKKDEEYEMYFNKLHFKIKIKVIYDTRECNKINNAQKIFIE